MKSKSPLARWRALACPGRADACPGRALASLTLTAALFLILVLPARSGFAQRPSDAPVASIAGQSLDACAQDLQSPNRVVRLRAIRTLGFFGQPAADALLEALQHDDTAVRFLAAAHVGRLGGKALEQAQPQLAKLVAQDQPLPVQMSAAYALCEAGQTKQYLPALITGLQHSERGVACHAADLLARLGKDAQGARSALQDVYARNKPGVKGGDYHLGGAANNALRRLDAK